MNHPHPLFFWDQRIRRTRAAAGLVDVVRAFAGLTGNAWRAGSWLVRVALILGVAFFFVGAGVAAAGVAVASMAVGGGR